MNHSFMKKEEIMDDLCLRYPCLAECQEQIEKSFELLKESFLQGKTLYVAGNGGSASDSEHIVGELMKSFMAKRSLSKEEKKQYSDSYGEEGKRLADCLERGLPAVSLPSFVSLATAISNDMSGEYIFAQTLNSVSKEGDVFLGISTSGNSKNIVDTFMVASVKGLKKIGLTGKNLCKMDDICDVVIHVPEVETYKIQELHLPVYHAICAMLESEFFKG